MARYNFKEVEYRWQQQWAHQNLYRCAPDSSQPKYYVLAMFPYPSGKIHMGHVRNYTITDVIARYKLACGYNVLHPMGWDAFGLPAEQYAMDTGNDPADFTAENIANFKRQINAGFYIAPTAVTPRLLATKATAKKTTENIAQAQIAKIEINVLATKATAKGITTRSIASRTRANTRMTKLVASLSLAFVFKDLVGFVNFFEFCFVTTLFIGVMFNCFLAESFFNFIIAGTLANP